MNETNTQKAYERYRAAFAKDRGISIKEATGCAIVKEYKKYIEETNDTRVFE